MTSPERVDPTAPRVPVGGVVAAVVGVWFALAIWAAWAGFLQSPPGEPPFALLAFVLIPVAAFLAVYRIAPAFRSFVLGSELRLLTMLQAWRMGGFLFLVLMTYDLLPGLFAWPSGVGDMAVGLTAPLVALALVKRPATAATSAFVAWNVFGIVDFIVALGTGVATSGAIPALTRDTASASMALLPLSLVPSFMVPLLAVLHLTAILQARRAMRLNRAAAGS